MGQYWKLCNLDKREFVHPHKLDVGLKLLEQVGSTPGVGDAMIILCAAMPERRGGGDFHIETDVTKRVVGRWAGDRVALVGDYREAGDIAGYDVTRIRFGPQDESEETDHDYEVFYDISSDVKAALDEVMTQ